MKEGYILAKGEMETDRLLKVWMDFHFLVVKQLKRFEILPTADMKRNLELLLEEDKNVYIATLTLASRLKSVLNLFSGFYNLGIYSTLYPIAIRSGSWRVKQTGLFLRLNVTASLNR